MIDSVILRTTTRLVFPLMLVLSVFFLMRGHNEPGGGFVGGLTAATAFAVVLASDGLGTARRLLRLHPLTFVALGLATALLSGVFPLLDGRSFLTGLWWDGKVPVVGHLGSPLAFDLGVYLTVVGVTLAIVFELAVELE